MNRLHRLTTTGASGLPRRPMSAGGAGVAAAWLSLLLAACGGGGGGGAEVPAAPGVVRVTVNDTFGATVAGAKVQGPRSQSTTDAQGVALVLTDAPDSTAQVTVTRTSFVDQSVAATSATGRVNELKVTLDRATSAAGGSLASRSGVAPSLDSSGQQLSFEIELVVVDGQSQPIENLSAADFVLRACTPNPINDQVDCVRGSDTSADVAYAPTASTPQAAALIPGQAARPYAAALLLDQSGSILQSDATGARLFSSKAFMRGLGADDQVLLTAFAGGAGAIIPTRPLTVYAPFRQQADASSYFATLDTLALQVGGNTPLYESIDTVRQQLAAGASVPNGMARAMVIFTDGADTGCSSVQACRANREQSIAAARRDQVRLFTIGLSSGVDIAALGELANQTGGALLYADTAEQLLPLYGSVGRLLSLSLPTYRLRWTVQAAAAGSLRPGSSLLGRVQVNVGKRSFDVPFVVGIP